VEKVLSLDKRLVPRSVVRIISLASQPLISTSLSVFDQCKTSTMATKLEPLIDLWQATSLSQSSTNTSPSRFSKLFAEPVLLGPEPSLERVGEELFRLLPPLPEAIRLCEAYREHGKYMQACFISEYIAQLIFNLYRCAPIPREELFDEILEPIYRAECV
jgi:hypothetical protein